MQKSKQNWFQKHKALSVVLATVGFFILLFAILSLGGGSGSSDDPLRVDNSQSGGEATQAEEKFEVSVGEAATRNNRTLTVNEVQRNYPGANEYSNPETGKEYVLITLTLENKDNDSLSFSGSDFKVQDSQGVQTASKYTGEMDGELNFGSLAPGGKVSGKLAFEVPEGDTNLKLVYTTDLFSGDEIIVNLGE